MRISQIVPMASFLASCFSSHDQSALVVDALQMTELLLTKVPDMYQYYFRREGVMHEIEIMASEALSTAHKPKKAPSSSASTPAASAPHTPLLEIAASVNDGEDAVDLETRLAPRASDTYSDATKSFSVTDALLKDSITLRSRHLQKVLTASSTSRDGSSKADSALSTIRKLVSNLEICAVSGGSAEAAKEQASQTMMRIAQLFTAEGAMSSFEMQESGLISGMLKFATSVPESICTF